MIVDVVGLREIEDVSLFHYVDAEEALQIVGLRYRELLLQDPTQVVDEGLIGCCDREVVHVYTEYDLLAVGAELVEEAGVEWRSEVLVGDEVSTECVVEGLGGSI